MLNPAPRSFQKIPGGFSAPLWTRLVTRPVSLLALSLVFWAACGGSPPFPVPLPPDPPPPSPGPSPGPPAPTPDPYAYPIGPDALDDELLGLFNAERSRRGLSTLTLDADLDGAADSQSGWLAHTGSAALHDGYARTSFVDRCGDQGFDGSPTGEIAAMGQGTPRVVLGDWLNSPGHKSILLNRRARRVGISSRDGPSGRIWVAVFGD